MGIVNITEDSFSDGGQFLDRVKLEDHVRELADECSILDLGPASSNPAAHPVSCEVAIRRLEMALQIRASLRERELISNELSISIDSFDPLVQRFALQNADSHGIRFLNDITGFKHTELYGELADSSCRLIVMHAIQEGVATTVEFDPKRIMGRIYSFFDNRLEAMQRAGIDKSRLILDPGMGFFLGSNAEASFEVLRRLPDLQQRYELPLLVSVSRKSFLGAATNRAVNKRAAATLAAELYIAHSGVEYVRTHDPGALQDAITVLNRISGLQDGQESPD
jgi:dihydropteroate synthase type 2